MRPEPKKNVELTCCNDLCGVTKLFGIFHCKKMIFKKMITRGTSFSLIIFLIANYNQIKSNHNDNIYFPSSDVKYLSNFAEISSIMVNLNRRLLNDKF